jgi:hypothetical protein
MSNHDKVIENVIDVIEKNGKIAVDGYEALKTIDLIEKIYGSIERDEFMVNNQQELIFVQPILNKINKNVQDTNTATAAAV